MLSFHFKEKDSSFSCPNSAKVPPGKFGLQNGTGAVNQFSATKCDLQNWFEVVLAGYHLCWGEIKTVIHPHEAPNSLEASGVCWFITTAAFPTGTKTASGDSALQLVY